MGGPDDDWKRLIESDIAEARKDIDALKAFRNWIVGGTAVLAYFAGYMSDIVKHAFGFKP